MGIAESEPSVVRTAGGRETAGKRLESAAAALAVDPARRRTFEIPSLDGFRAVSFMLVFLSHTRLNGVIPGGFGVTVFFFLSGYLITTLLRREGERHGRISLRKFYMRRILRIMPPMYLSILIGLVLVLTHVAPNEPLRTPGLLAQTLHFTNYYMIFGQPLGHRGLIEGLTTLWSLAVEEHFYLVFPLLYILLRRYLHKPRDQAAVLLGIWTAISAWRCVLVWFLHADVQRASLATDTRLDSILIGCVLAIYANPFTDPTELSERVWKHVLAIGVAVLMISFLLPGVWLRESIRYSLQNWGLIPIFVCGIRYPHWGPFKLMNIGWVKFMGVLSYSLYLIHRPMLDVSYHWLGFTPRVVQEIVALVISILAATLIYIFVERPCARLRKRFGFS